MRLESRIFVYVLVCMGLCMAWAVGCTTNTEPMERFGNRMIDDVLKPAVEKSGNELVARASQIQGQASAIEPGYEVSGFAGLINGVVYDLKIRLVGVSANLAGATQADQGDALPVPPPAIREPPVTAPTPDTGPS